ncbi:hypothetical protein ECANGB1_2405 [Enterospora canceri]|nr:hypothetical protein ECANGB1_2405 [Enterospora canceri]
MLYLYYTVIGVIQRDCHTDTVDETMLFLSDEIHKLRDEIHDCLESAQSADTPITISEIVSEKEDKIESGRIFIDGILSVYL